PVEVPKEPWLGISGSNVTPAIAQELNLEEARGFLIVEVQPGSPAATAGLQGGDVGRVVEVEGEPIALGGDVVIEIDDTPIANADDIRRVLDLKEVGDSIEFTVIREAATEPLEVLVILGEQ
ncbi:MAG: S1C family serine protease, partial [Nitrososphaera sp.]